MRNLSLILVSAIMVIGCTPSEVGSKRRPFTMYFVPSVDSQKLADVSTKVTKFISKSMSQKLYQKDTGFYAEGSVPTSYIAVVEAFGTKRADFATLTTFAYILAKDIKKYDVNAVMTVYRQTVMGMEHTYKGQILAHVDSGIKSVKDLSGKKFAFTDPASTSGFILPQKLIKDNGVELGETIFAQKHDNVVSMIYQKQVPAGATYYSSPRVEEKDGKKTQIIQDARARVKTQYPDVEEKVKIIAFTDDIPNEPWVMRNNIWADPKKNEDLRQMILESLEEYAKTAEGLEMINVLSTAVGVVRVDDSAYEEIRTMVQDSTLDLQDILSKQKS